MFHCNGWCFPWAVTAVAGTHVCLRKIEPARDLGAARGRGRDAPRGAPTVAIALANDPAPPARTRRSRCHGRRAAVADAARPAGRTRLPPAARLRADRDLRPDTLCVWHDGVGRARRRRAGAGCSPARASATYGRRRPGDGRAIADVAADGRSLGEVVHAGQHRHEGLLPGPATRPLGRSRAAGSTPATSPSGIRTATSSSATGRRT